MSSKASLWRIACCLTVHVLLAGGSSCAVPADIRPRAWIDVPKNGAQVSVNTPVVVNCHAYAQEGVTEVLLSVNGDPYVRKPSSEQGAQFAEVTLEWLPQEAGEYVLQVRAYDTKGEESHPSSITVHVVHGLTLRMTATPVEALTPIPTEETAAAATATVVQTATATATGNPTGTETRAPTETAVHSPTGTATSTTTSAPSPTNTATSMPTITPTSIPPVEASLWVDQESITAGECTLLHWGVEHATSIQLDGQAVAAQGTRQVCPTSTTTYHLRVEAPGGDVDRIVTVTVTAAPDTTPPTITNITPSAGLIRPPDCDPDSVTISATITDPSGVPKVELHYRVVGTGASWLWRSMSPTGGDVYEATLGDAQLRSSLFPYEDADTVQYYIKAWDSRTNMTQSSTQTVGVDFCVL
jgi:hypothetical protein